MKRPRSPSRKTSQAVMRGTYLRIFTATGDPRTAAREAQRAYQDHWIEQWAQFDRDMAQYRYEQSRNNRPQRRFLSRGRPIDTIKKRPRDDEDDPPPAPIQNIPVQ